MSPQGNPALSPGFAFSFGGFKTADCTAVPWKGKSDVSVTEISFLPPLEAENYNKHYKYFVRHLVSLPVSLQPFLFYTASQQHKTTKTKFCSEKSYYKSYRKNKACSGSSAHGVRCSHPLSTLPRQRGYLLTRFCEVSSGKSLGSLTSFQAAEPEGPTVCKLQWRYLQHKRSLLNHWQHFCIWVVRISGKGGTFWLRTRRLCVGCLGAIYGHLNLTCYENICIEYLAINKL